MSSDINSEDFDFNDFIFDNDIEMIKVAAGRSVSLETLPDRLERTQATRHRSVLPQLEHRHAQKGTEADPSQGRGHGEDA